MRLVCYVQSPRAAEEACARACVSHLVFYTGIAQNVTSAYIAEQLLRDLAEKYYKSLYYFVYLLGLVR